jgi:drug/metabolite transporter (DMT)-like permease
MQAVAVVGVLSVLSFTPLYFIFLDNIFITATMMDLSFQIFYQGIIAALFFTCGIQILGPVKIALFISLVPVIGTLIAIPVLDELPGVVESVGIIVVVLGVLAAMGVRISMFSKWI